MNRNPPTAPAVQAVATVFKTPLGSTIKYAAHVRKPDGGDHVVITFDNGHELRMSPCEDRVGGLVVQVVKL
jgi:hypothetical protein